LPNTLEAFTQQVNFTRYHGQPQGHYESFFQRANHPTRPLAFWIRYTIFSPKGRPHDALGELWAIFFNGETGSHVAVKKEAPMQQCTFRPAEFFVEINDAQLKPGQLHGSAGTGQNTITWDLSFRSDAPPLLLLPLRLYETALPSAKSLVSAPIATYQGHLTVNGETIDVADWVGSQNHNWGSKHTDRYAWGQVAGFDTHPESFLEVATARLKLGPLWTPPITLIVLRHNGKEIALNSLPQSVKAKGAFDYFTWKFASATQEVAVTGTISAPREAFVGLNYYNPPGGNKHCLNTKLASCELRLKDRQSNEEEVLSTVHRAAFEILTDDRDHGVEIRA
jgi:hypothetical protein